MKKTVISIGNPLKSDDNIGNLILDKLKKTMNNVTFIRGSTNPENFIEPLKKIKPQIIFFVDVASFQGNIGDVKIFQLNDILDLNISTHNFPITVFRKFFPNSKIMLIGIKPKSLNIGEGLSLELKRRFDDIVEEVKTIIKNTI
jgi:hydrogenase 3 maturation protease